MAYNPNNANGQATSANSAPVVLASDQSAVATKVPDVTSTASISANATAGAACTSNGAAGTFTVQLTGTFVATVQIQVTIDYTNWVNVIGGNCIVSMASASYVPSGNITSTGIFQLDVSGVLAARVITTAYTSGTIVVSTRLSEGAGMVSIEGVPTVTVSSGSITITPTSATAYSAVTLATTNAASIKTTAGNVYEFAVANLTANPIYVKFYNKNSAPTVGTDTPIFTIPVAANATLMQEFGVVGKRFPVGIALAVTGAAAATDTTAIAAGAQVSLTYT